jgi:hexosaminidase
MRGLSAAVALAIAAPVAAQQPAVHVVPGPAHVVTGDGHFVLGPATALVARGGRDASRAAERLREVVLETTGRTLGDSTGGAGGTVLLHLDPAFPDPTREGYRLVVAPRGITLTARSGAGLFYGAETLRQLLGPDGAAPVVTIDDAPRFRWRGMHLDVGRHFRDVDFVKRYIDLLARYKLNTFHWHLTEDQGWRLEIRKYPRLTEVGACRAETVVAREFDPYRGDGVPHCGFYTQDEVREVVRYAAERHVTVVPEIEMPGHSQAALAAYPELGCGPGPYSVWTMWGVSEHIYCPSEPTFAFLQDVLGEVMELFPSKFIHIGGDEAPKTAWKRSELAQQVMRRERLKNEEELQSWFIHRIDRFLTSNGRRLVGWDEILEGGLAPGATVMSWRGMVGGIAAARAGHDVVMTPTSHLYFDYYQGDPRHEPLAGGGMVTLERVYGYEPVPSSLTRAQARHILGAQGNVWSEYMRDAAHVEYMAVPRMLALAEVVWSPRAARDWDGFVSRLPAQFTLLDRLGVNYRAPSVMGLEEDRLLLADTALVTLRAALAHATIRYTLDGGDPTSASPEYSSPFPLPVDDSGVVVSARAFLPGGRASPPRSARFTRGRLRPADVVDGAHLGRGLSLRYVEGPARRVADLDSLRVRRDTVSARVAVPPFARAEQWGVRFAGYVHVPSDGVWTFRLTSDDGSRLWIGDRLVVDGDGPHTAEERAGAIALRAGWHAIRVDYFQAGGGRALSLRVLAADGTELPARDMFRH